jgi:hypothetical protein
VRLIKKPKLKVKIGLIVSETICFFDQSSLCKIPAGNVEKPKLIAYLSFLVLARIPTGIITEKADGVT